jgi:hypothetical protein
MPSSARTESAAWPEGVIARYFTVGGATVDITVRLTLPPEPIPYATRAACTGCPDAKEFNHYRTYYGSGGFLSDAREEHEPEVADEAARTWAQSHAEKCRALPRPTA